MGLADFLGHALEVAEIAASLGPGASACFGRGDIACFDVGERPLKGTVPSAADAEGIGAAQDAAPRNGGIEVDEFEARHALEQHPQRGGHAAAR